MSLKEPVQQIGAALWTPDTSRGATTDRLAQMVGRMGVKSSAPEHPTKSPLVPKVTLAAHCEPCFLCHPRPSGHTGTSPSSGKPHSRLFRGSNETDARQIAFLSNFPRLPPAPTWLVPCMYHACTWLAPPNLLPSTWLVPGFDVALMWLWAAWPATLTGGRASSRAQMLPASAGEQGSRERSPSRMTILLAIGLCARSPEFPGPAAASG
jgi:hypothetical protein